MKTLFTLVLFLISLVTSADDRLRRYTTFEMYPAYPIDCRLKDAPLVNAYTKMEKTMETDETVTFEVSFQIGYCAGGRYNVFALPEFAIADVLRDAAYMPWQRDYANAKTLSRTNTDLLVELTFDKKGLFRKRSEAAYTIYFNPFGMGPGQRYFPWLATLSLVPESGVRLNLRPM